MMSETIMETARRHLMNAGINPSIQRLKIYAYLSQVHNHPTADAIHCRLVQDIPTLSKTTVYNTLSLFQRRGLVQGITIDENEVRYDADTSPHAHFRCERCGRIFDVPIDFATMSNCLDCEHQIKSYHVYLIGLCKECLES
jgi:Fe2+ or Zn2+ uptake regulation protein